MYRSRPLAGRVGDQGPGRRDELFLISLSALDKIPICHDESHLLVKHDKVEQELAVPAGW
jgi:hypothetical protein